MTLEKVSDEIILTAKKEAEKITGNAKLEAERIMRAAKKSVDEKQSLAERHAQNLIDAMSKKELASAKLEEKRLVLDAKKDVIEAAYAKLVRKIVSLDKKTKEKTYSELIKNTKNEFEPAYIYARKDDFPIIKKLAKKAKVIEENILGGLIFENAEKTVRIDKSFDSILVSVKSENIKEVSKILF